MFLIVHTRLLAICIGVVILDIHVLENCAENTKDTCPL